MIRQDLGLHAIPITLFRQVYLDIIRYRPTYNKLYTYYYAKYKRWFFTNNAQNIYFSGIDYVIQGILPPQLQHRFVRQIISWTKTKTKTNSSFLFPKILGPPRICDFFQKFNTIYQVQQYLHRNILRLQPVYGNMHAVLGFKLCTYAFFTLTAPTINVYVSLNVCYSFTLQIMNQIG